MAQNKPRRTSYTRLKYALRRSLRRLDFGTSINEHAYVYDLIKASTEENKLRELRGINEHAYVYDLIKGISEEILEEMRRRYRPA